MTLAALLVVLPLAGHAYETYADAHTRRTFQAPGMLVDVGGRRLHLVCIGDGFPIVLFEAPGFGVSSLSSATVRERVASRTTVCSYDRAGMGWSDPAPETLTAGALARDLAVLQDRRRIARAVRAGGLVGRRADGRDVCSPAPGADSRTDLPGRGNQRAWSTSWSRRRSSAAPAPPHQSS